MAIDASNIWQLTNALDIKPEDKTNTRLATVSRIDNEGHIWVSIPGGETETPTETTDVEVERGDTVTVEWRNNKLYVMGNSTQPATSRRRVVEIVEPVELLAAEAASGVGKAMDSSKAAQQAAAEAAAVAAATDQHFWHDDNGAHVTTEVEMVGGRTWGKFKNFTWGEYRGESWAEAAQAVLRHLADVGYNSLWNSLGWLLRYATNILVSITRSAVAFYDGVGNAASNIVAEFGMSLIRLGKQAEKHIDLTSSGLELFDGSTSMAEFTANKARIGEEAKGHVTTTTSQVQVWNGTSDVAVAKMGTGAVDTPHVNPVDGIFVPNGQVAATSLYSWASKTGWSMPTQVLHPGGQPITMVRGTMGFLQDGTPEVIAFNGFVAFGISDDGLLINLDNQKSGTQRKTGWFQIAWDGTVTGSGV